VTHHVTSDLNNLSSNLPYDGHDTLHIGNGVGMQILNISSSSIHVGSHTLVLCDILHVPSFTKNLLSLSKLLLDNSILIKFPLMFVSSRTASPRPSMLQHGLYSIHLPLSSSPHAFLGERVSADVWHARLVHPSSSTTLHILNSYVLPCSSKLLSLCQDCCMAKSHIYPFNLSTMAKAPPELIHFDLWGLSPVISRNGFRYYVFFIDDYT
jgi:GAG-pre-integrase domain